MVPVEWVKESSSVLIIESAHHTKKWSGISLSLSTLYDVVQCGMSFDQSEGCVTIEFNLVHVQYSVSYTPC